MGQVIDPQSSSPAEQRPQGIDVGDPPDGPCPDSMAIDALPVRAPVPVPRPVNRWMSRRTLDQVVAAVYAVLCFGAVLAPAVAVRWAVFRSDIQGVGGRDIVTASVLVGAGHAYIAWTRLRCEERTAMRRSHIWIASLNALVVLALSASLLVLGVLEHFAVEHAAIANRGLPVVGLWIGLQLIAVTLAELTGRFVFWWLEPQPEPCRDCRWGVLPPARRLARVPAPVLRAARLRAATIRTSRRSARARTAPRPLATMHDSGGHRPSKPSPAGRP
jgi:hypothetical protein